MADHRRGKGYLFRAVHQISEYNCNGDNVHGGSSFLRGLGETMQLDAIISVSPKINSGSVRFGLK